MRTTEANGGLLMVLTTMPMSRDEDLGGDDDDPAPSPDDGTHSSRPLHYEQLLVGRKPGASDDNNKGWGSTHCHAYKLLLIGWFMDYLSSNDNKNDRGQG